MAVLFKRYKSKLLFYAILSILLTLLSISTPATRLIYPFIAALIVTVLFVILVIFVVIRRLKWDNISKHILYFLGVIILSGVFHILIIRYQIKETEKSGDKLVIALNNFYEKNKRYPNNIHDLAPEFIDKIPKSKMGLQVEDFYYTHDQNKTFELSFDVDDFIQHYKLSNGNQWYSND